MYSTCQIVHRNPFQSGLNFANLIFQIYDHLRFRTIQHSDVRLKNLLGISKLEINLKFIMDLDRHTSKGPSINYVISKLANFDPLLYLVVFLLSKIGTFCPHPSPMRRHSLWTAPNQSDKVQIDFNN